MNKRIISGIAALSLVLTSAAVPAFADEVEGEYDANPNFAVAEDADEDASAYAFVDDAAAAFDDDSASNTVNEPVVSEEPVVNSNVDDANGGRGPASFYNGGFNNGFYGPNYGYGYGFNNGFANRPTTEVTKEVTGPTTSTDGDTTTTTTTYTTTVKTTKKNKTTYTYTVPHGPSFWDMGKVNWFYGFNNDDYKNAPTIPDHVYGYGKNDPYMPIVNWRAVVADFNDGVEDGKPTPAPVAHFFHTSFRPFWSAPVKVTKAKKCTKKKAKKCKKVATKVVYKPVVVVAPTPAPRQIVYAPLNNFRSYLRGVHFNSHHTNKTWNWGWGTWFPTVVKK